MALLSQEQMREFIATNHFRTPEDVQTALTGLFAETLQAMLDAELETHLGYPKHAIGPKPTANRRNGRYPKQVTTQYGEGALQVPGTATGVSRPPSCCPTRPRWSASRTRWWGCTPTG